jgi:HlyD family secretion protein
VATLLVDEGSSVRAGQLLATIDTEPVLEASVEEMDAELRNAERELARVKELNLGKAVSDAERDRWETRVSVARAKLTRARAELARARISAPASGLVVDVHARPGERIGPEGLLEIARVDRMYAIAEVYETDVGRVRVGQRARATSPALPQPLAGGVEWIRPKVEKQDEIGTDPAARKDARVVEVKILLDDSAAAAPFTNLQVDVEIEP